MKWLLDANDNIMTRNGQPVLIREDGSEMEFDGPAALGKITALNKENQTFRTQLKASEEKLAAFGDADPAAINEFRAEMDALGGKDGLDQLKAKGTVDVDGLKKQITTVYDEKIRNINEANKTALRGKDDHIYRLEVSTKFAASQFIAEKLTIPPDMAEATFGKNFKIEDGKMVAYLGEEKIWSKKNPGELADFEEAIELCVGAYNQKDRITVGANASGNGTKQLNQNNQKQVANDNLTSTQKIAAGLKQLTA